MDSLCCVESFCSFKTWPLKSQLWPLTYRFSHLQSWVWFCQLFSSGLELSCKVYRVCSRNHSQGQVNTLHSNGTDLKAFYYYKRLIFQKPFSGLLVKFYMLIMYPQYVSFICFLHLFPSPALISRCKNDSKLLLSSDCCLYYKTL